MQSPGSKAVTDPTPKPARQLGHDSIPRPYASSRQEHAVGIHLSAKREKIVPSRSVSPQMRGAEIGIDRQIFAPVQAVAKRLEQAPELHEPSARRVAVVASKPEQIDAQRIAFVGGMHPGLGSARGVDLADERAGGVVARAIVVLAKRTHHFTGSIERNPDLGELGGEACVGHLVVHGKPLAPAVPEALRNRARLRELTQDGRQHARRELAT